LTRDLATPDGRTRIVVADDHSIVLEGLVALLENEPGMQVVGQATTGRQALEEVRRGRPDVALLDITMPEMSGLEITRQLTDEMPEVRTLILTMHDEDAFFFEALQAGASGYVLKGADKEEILSAIAVVAGGGVSDCESAEGNTRGRHDTDIGCCPGGQFTLYPAERVHG